MNTDTPDNEDLTSAARPGLSRRRLRMSLVTLCLAVLVVAAASGTVTALPTAQIDGETENASATDDGIINIGGDRPVLDQLWCSIFGCPKPVEVTQSETVVIEETPATQQNDSSEPTVPNTTDTAESNTTVAAGVSGSRDETTASVPEGNETTASVPEGNETTASVPEGNETTDASSEPSDTQRPVVNVTIDEQASTGQWWWPLVVALFALTTVGLIAAALYRRFPSSEPRPETGAYPATLQPRIVRSRAQPRASDGGETMAAAASADATTAEPRQLTDARAALSDGSPDQAVILAVQALANATDHDERVRRYDGLLRSWESTADAAATALPLNQLRVCYEQAAFSPDPVAEATAMKCVETAETLLSARDSKS
jgi:hypothetical protein